MNPHTVHIYVVLYQRRKQHWDYFSPCYFILIVSFLTDKTRHHGKEGSISITTTLSNINKKAGTGLLSSCIYNITTNNSTEVFQSSVSTSQQGRFFMPFTGLCHKVHTTCKISAF